MISIPCLLTDCWPQSRQIFWRKFILKCAYMSIPPSWYLELLLSTTYKGDKSYVSRCNRSNLSNHHEYLHERTWYNHSPRDVKTDLRTIGWAGSSRVFLNKRVVNKLVCYLKLPYWSLFLFISLWKWQKFNYDKVANHLA